MSRPQLEQVIECLNRDLSYEYGAMVQYIQHASMLTGPEYIAVIDELLQHAQDEHQHAVIISDLIQYLGGVPTVEVAPRLTSMDNVEMLRQDLQGEYGAIRAYLQRIEQLEALRLYDAAQKIRNIAMTEQDHAIDLEKALGLPVTPRDRGLA